MITPRPGNDSKIVLRSASNSTTIAESRSHSTRWPSTPAIVANFPRHACCLNVVWRYGRTWANRGHRPRAQQPRQRNQVTRRICASVFDLRRVPDDVPPSRRWRWCRLDIELPGRRRARKGELGRGPLILRTESGSISRTAGRLGNCERALGFSESKLRSGERRRSAPSLWGKHPDVPGVGLQTRHRASARMSGCECGGAIERAGNRCIWLELQPHYGNDWARRLRRANKQDWRRHWTSRAGHLAMLQVWRRGWKAGRCRSSKRFGRRWAERWNLAFGIGAPLKSVRGVGIDQAPHSRDAIRRKASAAAITVPFRLEPGTRNRTYRR